MILHIIFIALSAIVSITSFIFIGVFDIWYYYLLIIPIFIASYLALSILFIIYLAITMLFMNKKKPVSKPNMLCYKTITEFIYLLFKYTNVKIHTNNLDLMPRERCMIVSNHISAFDPMIFLLKNNNKPLICVTKPENLNIPLAGPYIHSAGFIAINRDNNFEAAKAIAKATQFIKKDMSSIYICPEGTRNTTSEPTLPFHAGSFKIGVKAMCPIVITSVKNTNKIAKGFIFKRKNIYLNVLRVLEYDDYKNMNTTEIANLARAIIEADLKQN